MIMYYWSVFLGYHIWCRFTSSAHDDHDEVICFCVEAVFQCPSLSEKVTAFVFCLGRHPCPSTVT